MDGQQEIQKTTLESLTKIQTLSTEKLALKGELEEVKMLNLKLTE